MNRLGIIIPVYNERDNIKRTLDAICSNITTGYRIYLVYDFDDDNTLPVIANLVTMGWNIVLLKNHDRGVVNALKLGLRLAEEEFVLVVMADMSDDLSIVDSMIQKMDEGYDVVCGSRYMNGGKQIGGPLIKRTLSRIAGVSLKYLAGLPTHDVTNSFKLYRKSRLDKISLDSEGGFEIGMEIVVKTYMDGGQIAEIPSTWIDRTCGESRFRILKWMPCYLKWYLLAITHARLQSRTDQNRPKK